MMSLPARIRWLTVCVMTAISTLALPIPVRAVDRIVLHYPPFKDMAISVRDLEIFAKTGRVAPDFATYIRSVKPAQLQQLRQLLQQRMKVSPTYITQLTNSPLTQTLLERLGEVIQTENLTNGKKSLSLAMVRGATDQKEGLTTINFLHRFPGRQLQVNLTEGFRVYANLSELLKQRDLMIVALRQIAQADATTTKIDFSNRLDLRKRGELSYQKRRFEWLDRSRQRVVPGDLYLPQTTSTSPIPVIVISHGVAEDRQTFAYLAEHLASYGFAVAVVEHIGGNTDRFKQYFSGLAPAPAATELLQRPRDVSFVLDELQRLAVNDPILRQLDLQQVGVIGHSLGGYTALALAGATIDFDRVKQDCEPNRSLNLSVLLQCRAQKLPPSRYLLQDPRIKAIFAINPLNSTIFGQRGMSQIRIPVFLMGGSDDIVTPAVPEQIYPFTWLQTSEKYLAILEKGTHFSTPAVSPQDRLFPVSDSLIGPDPQLARTYAKALSVAFFQTHLAQRREFQSYLNAAYATSISRVPLPLNLVRSSASAQIVQMLQPDNFRVAIPVNRENR